MSRSSISIGPAPAEESCSAVGEANYMANARRECQAFIQAIRLKLGPEPEGAELRTVSCVHDFGMYLDVVCTFDESHPVAVDYAFRCESDAPKTWAEVGMTAPRQVRGRGR